MIDHRSYTHNLSSYEIKAWNKFLGLNRIRTHDLCDTGAVLYWLSYQAIRELGSNPVQAQKFLSGFNFTTAYTSVCNCFLRSSNIWSFIYSFAINKVIVSHWIVLHHIWSTFRLVNLKPTIWFFLDGVYMVRKLMLQTLLLTDNVSKVVTEKLPFNDTSKYVMVFGYWCDPCLLCRHLFLHCTWKWLIFFDCSWIHCCYCCYLGKLTAFWLVQFNIILDKFQVSENWTS